jgi:hypothetical protein
LGQVFGVLKMLRFVRRSLGLTVWGFVYWVPALVAADQPLAFPWGHARANTSVPRSATSAPYQILNTAIGKEPAKIALQQMSPKAGYAYGWFGSNPTPQFTRHLGFHQNYTQWKLTP